METVVDLARDPAGGTGWLVPPGDRRRWPRPSTRLALGPEARFAIGRRGRANAEAHFASPAMCAATLQV
ncbi:MAG: hypothetical protein R3F55_21170 [Alphaproteobacteria bacterium]